MTRTPSVKDAREMLPVLQERSPETEQATASEPPPEQFAQ